MLHTLSTCTLVAAAVAAAAVTSVDSKSPSTPALSAGVTPTSPAALSSRPAASLHSSASVLASSGPISHATGPTSSADAGAAASGKPSQPASKASLTASPSSTLRTSHTIPPNALYQPAVSAVPFKVPPQPAFDYTMAPEKYDELVTIALEQLKAIDESLGDISDETATWDNIIAPQLEEGVFGDFYLQPVWAIGYLSADKKVTDASKAAYDRYFNYSTEPELNKRIGDVSKKYIEGKHADVKDDEIKLYLESMVKTYASPENSLSDADSEQYGELSSNITELGNKFVECLDNDQTIYWISKADLEGVPETLYANLQTRQGPNGVEYGIGFLDDTSNRIETFLKKIEVRRDLITVDTNVCNGNPELEAEQTADKRALAKLLKYDTYADYVLKDETAGNLTTVMNFLTKLRAALTPFSHNDLDGLAKLKAADKDADKLPFNGFDLQYYMQVNDNVTQQINIESLSQYFPIDYTISAVLQVVEDVFSIKYVEVAGDDKKVWDPLVRQYAVWHVNGSFVGWFYLDLFARTGAASNEETSSLQIPSTNLTSGERRYGSVLVKMLVQPGRPTLQINDLSTLFHEIGHSIAFLLNECKLSYFDSFSLSRDSVEMPSQMLESFADQPAVIQRVSKDNTTGKPMPDDLIAHYILSLHNDKAYLELRQVYLGLYDQLIHSTVDFMSQTAPKEASQELAAEWPSLNASARVVDFWNDLRKTMFNLTFLDENGKMVELPGVSAFQHPVSGYDAAYYSYQWSRVASKDIFYSLFAPKQEEVDAWITRNVNSDGSKQDPAPVGKLFDASAGQVYVKRLLSKGASIPFPTLIQNVLGREISEKPYLESIGLNSTTGIRRRTLALSGPAARVPLH
ncbi:metalloendopeptidase [Savitreella phatthalungensis]